MLRTSESLPSDSTDAGPVSDDGPRRIVAQRGLFAGPSALVPDDLYARVERGDAVRVRDEIRLLPHAQVSTNTYFGRFHATYWQRWTDVTAVEIQAVVSGTGRVRVVATDTNKVPRTVAVSDVSDAAAQTVRFVAPVDRFVDGGGIFLELSTADGELTVTGVRWLVAARRPEARTEVVVCTYNRVDDCLNTLTAMAADPEGLRTVGLVHVVDQGSDPLESRPRFAEVSAALGGQLHYLRQPNLGGAGGFTRGLFEATRGAPEEHADVFLMDDDVLLDPEILVRMTAFSACTTQPMIVGGQMLNLLHPTHLHITAEYADPERMLNGFPIAGALHNADLTALDDEGLPVNQERRVDTEYNGWWSCLIPAEIVRAIGYPLPVFFQWDDVEYSYRARHRGFPSVSLPGAGVWHADFGWKDWDEWHRYFNHRNGLITAAMHTAFDTRKVGKRVVALLAHYIVSMHYGLAVTTIKAVEDFLEGPEILRDGSESAAAEIRRIRAAYPETVMHPMTDLADVDVRDLTVVRAANPPGSEALTLLKRIAFAVLDRAPHQTGFVPAGDAHWWHVSTFRRAVVTDMSEQGYRVRTRDAATARQLALRGLRVLRRLQKEGPAVAQRYRAELPSLTSRSNWARLYDIDD